MIKILYIVIFIAGYISRILVDYLQKRPTLRDLKQQEARVKKLYEEFKKQGYIEK